MLLMIVDKVLSGVEFIAEMSRGMKAEGPRDGMKTDSVVSSEQKGENSWKAFTAQWGGLLSCRFPSPNIK
ncbi:hypothetical protein KQX54_014863 [Cotesia glomerata]|uniref:Uncharacterized protein n=1 Tax=Cotesia glomerata TaxID=32391 RepID=A0AAV7IVQ8_COTGL|nr:hypothetical protein KQX54_014863 [Cotesia glomerata]